MQFTRSSLLGLALFAVSAGPSFAGEASVLGQPLSAIEKHKGPLGLRPTTTEKRLALARKLMEAMHVSDLARKTLPEIRTLMKRALMSQGADQAKADNIIAWYFVQNEAGQLAFFVDREASVYADLFSEEDLVKMYAFYKSSTGQRMLAKNSEISNLNSVIFRDWGETMILRMVLSYQQEKTRKSPAAAP
ncbi:DUF2059 domain-containing protein [Labrys neptuniae]